MRNPLKRQGTARHTGLASDGNPTPAPDGAGVELRGNVQDIGAVCHMAPNVWSVIEKIARADGTPTGETVRRAVSLLAHVREWYGDGKTIVIWDPAAPDVLQSVEIPWLK